MIAPSLRSALRLALMPVGIVLISSSAHANVVCSDRSPGINFGQANVSTNLGASGTGSIGYTCTNYNTTPVTFSLCVGMGTPSYPGSVTLPEMLGNNGSTVAFNLYTNAPNGQVWTVSNPISLPISIPGGIGNSVSGSFSFYGYIPGNQIAPAGSYNASFFNVLLGFLSGAQCGQLNGYSGLDFTLPVTATLTNACAVGATPTLNLGSVNANATNITGSNTISVTCPLNTPYYIGLSPSNANMSGAGVMSGSGNNTDRVPYQLHSASATGPIWGNTATATSVGNGVAGRGSGTAQSVTVYASVPSADYTPGTYSDTVTIYVNY